MDTSEESKNKVTLDELKTFLDNKFKPKPNEELPEIMNNEEMENFFNSKIIPVYEKILSQLTVYFDYKAKFYTHVRVASIRIVEDMSLFYFKVDINNTKRQINIIYDLNYRKAKKKKLSKTQTIEKVSISFRDIDTINEEMLITLFSKWYMGKDELIQKFIEKAANNL